MGKLTFLSHSAWQIETDQHTILIDPFLSGNPLAKIKPEDVRADFIIVTHAHGLHIGIHEDQIGLIPHVGPHPSG